MTFVHESEREKKRDAHVHHNAEILTGTEREGAAGAWGLPSALFVVGGGGGVSLHGVGHEESVGARGGEGMAWSHNLKAQEAKCPQQ